MTIKDLIMSLNSMATHLPSGVDAEVFLTHCDDASGVVTEWRVDPDADRYDFQVARDDDALVIEVMN